MREIRRFLLVVSFELSVAGFFKLRGLERVRRLELWTDRSFIDDEDEDDDWDDTPKRK